MRQFQSEIAVQTRGQRLHEITDDIVAVVRKAEVSTGLVTLFCRHTSCSLIINENADPDVRHDLEAFMKRMVPDGDLAFIHRLEGPDDMAAHIKTALTATSLAIPVVDGAGHVAGDLSLRAPGGAAPQADSGTYLGNVRHSSVLVR